MKSYLTGLTFMFLLWAFNDRPLEITEALLSFSIGFMVSKLEIIEEKLK